MILITAPVKTLLQTKQRGYQSLQPTYFGHRAKSSAPAYVGRKRWAKPNNRFRSRSTQTPEIAKQTFRTEYLTTNKTEGAPHLARFSRDVGYHSRQPTYFGHRAKSKEPPESPKFGCPLNRKTHHPVQPLHKHRRILQRHALHKQRLIKQQPSRILRNRVIRTCQQLLHNLVIRIDLECRL